MSGRRMREIAEALVSNVSAPCNHCHTHAVDFAPAVERAIAAAIKRMDEQWERPVLRAYAWDAALTAMREGHETTNRAASGAEE